MAKDITFRILAQDLASPAFRSVAKSAEEAGLKVEASGKSASGLSGLQKFAAGAALAIGATAVKSVQLAAQFQSSMEHLHTQAGVAQSSIKGLSDGVLDLAGKVGIGPTSLADSLYHIESTFEKTGLSASKAMDLLKTAAEGARVGGSNLVDTTNAIDAAVISGIPGVENFDQAMGALNATVGAGDQTMQDLADAIGTGVLSVVKGFGVTLSDASAALAVFGDNNIRGAEAGTALRQSVMALADPAAKGAANLHALGLSTQTLGQDMQKGGLNRALTDLVTHLEDAGITGNKVGQWLTETFGKKAGVGINILVTQLGLLQEAYNTVDKAQHSFDEAVSANNKTLSQQWAQFTAGLQAGMIKVGRTLTPIAEDGLHALSALGSGAAVVGHGLADMKSQLVDLAITAGALWAVFRGGPMVIGLAGKALYELRFNALVAQEALAGLGGGSAILGAAMGGALAGGIFLAVQGISAFVSGSHEAQTAIEKMNADLAKTPLSTSAYDSAIDDVNTKIASLKKQLAGGGGFLGWFTGSSENAAGQLDKYRSQLDGLTTAAEKAATRNKILAQQLSPGKGPFGAFGTDPAAYRANLAAINAMTAAGVTFNGTFDDSKTKVAAYIAASKEGAPAAAATAAYLAAEGKSAGDAADQIDALVKAMDSLAGKNQTILGDQIAAVGAIDDLEKSVDASSRSLDVNTAAGRTNLGAINDAAGAIEKYAQDQLKAGDGSASAIGKVNQTLYFQAVALENQAVKLGFSRDQARALIQQLLAMPPTASTKVSTPGASTATGQVEALLHALADVQGQRTININLVSNASSVLGSIQSMINNLNPNIPLTVSGYGNLSKLTSPQFHAGGGIAQGWSWVGERGPELIHVGSPSRVLTAPESAAVASGGGVSLTFNVSTPNVQSFRQWLNSPGVAAEVVDAMDRHKGRGSSVPAWMQ